MRASKSASQLIESLEYPASKEEILTAAREAQIDPTVQDSLKRIPDREYSKPEELTEALTASS